ncbi:FAP24 [Auxenochlorella protothecoides x Auxenochlorella symbiontica]|uniref:Uncharacterized protein n=1 Tax=Auxenochlorella protothecoides TaxID=3075 RepID=A0A1D2AFV1_AUXPR
MTCRCILLVALVASASAASVFQRPINSDCVRVSTASTDASLFPNEFQISGTAVVNSDDYTEVETSTGFTVTYYDNYKVLNNTLAGEAYTLTQCGVSVAANELPSDARPFSIPLISLSLPETVPYAFLELLGVTDRVYDVSEYVVAPCGQRLVQSCNRVAPDSLSLNNATLLSSTIGAYTDGLVTSSNSAWPTQFTFSATEDPGLLQRAEWIKFLGVFFNLDAYSSNLFTAIKNEFEQTKAAALAQEGPKPVVAWINHFMYGTQEWYQLSFAAYKTELVEAAGGQNLNYTDILEIEGVQPTEFSPSDLAFAWGTNETFANQTLALEAFLSVLAEVDIVIDETFVADPSTYHLGEFLMQFSSEGVFPTAEDVWFSAGKILRTDGLISAAAGLDWYEGAIPRPGKVLLDLVATTRPEALTATHTPIWLRNIKDDPVVVTAADCTTAANGCSASPSTICPFISFCGNGSPVLLETNLTTGALPTGGKCTYAACPAA